MKTMTTTIAVIAAILTTAVGAEREAHAKGKLHVACTLTTLTDIVGEVGGDKVAAFSLGAGDQDPHYVSPTPSLMKRVRHADMLFEMGMQLELWADQVADGSGNPKIFRGAPGRIILSTGIPKLEVPSRISRAEGDIHPEGNPHMWLDPIRAKMIAANAAKALAHHSPENAAYFKNRLRAFQKRVDKALFGDELLAIVGSRKLSRLALDGKLQSFLTKREFRGKKLYDYAGGWLAQARPLVGQKAIEYHKVWIYMATTFGFHLVGTIEEKPGIAPGPRHVRDTIKQVKREGIKLILVDNFYDPKLPNRIGREGGANVLVLPDQVLGEKRVKDYFSLMNRVVGAMVAGVK